MSNDEVLRQLLQFASYLIGQYLIDIERIKINRKFNARS